MKALDAFRLFPVAAMSIAVVACGSDSTAPKTVNIGGAWSYVESFNSSSAGISCNDQGSIAISQNGSNFTGSVQQTGLCTDSYGNTVDNSGSGSVGGGQISGSDVSFSASACNYSGAISGDPANRMSGSLTCSLAVSGQSYTFTGNWTATR